jgi:methionyl-tRNA formyltransferase
MRIVFFGTPAFAVPSLETLLHRGEVLAGVITQPDRPRGRSRSKLEPPPVKARAVRAGIPVLQPERPAGDSFLATLRALDPRLGVVVAYGHLLKPEVLAVPPLGMINVHASLLPELRGAAPIPWAILRGDRETGVTIMQMEAGMDSGPILHQLATPIGPDETGGELSERLARLGARALGEALDRLVAGELKPAPQDSTRASLAPKISRALAWVDWNEPAEQCARRIRAFDPTPGAWTTLPGGELKCFRPTLIRGSDAPSGTILEAADRLVVAARDGAVAIGEVQPAGRARMPAAAWLHGRHAAVGARFG